jgi:hypothetical protein|tara:strand:+ start:100 stop:381 length:282 start_codon:yes stop_codon:yes gene_type:complete
MDSLRKEIEQEMKRARLDKGRLYDIILKLVDNSSVGGAATQGSRGPPGPPGPQGPQGPQGPTSPKSESKEATPIIDASVKKVPIKKAPVKKVV